MKILQIHNRYNNYGGEDTVVDNERKLLLDNDFEVEQLFFDNSEISPFELFFNKEAYTMVNDKINEFKPQVVHIHNIFYKASPSVLKAAKANGVPTVLTLHNFRLLCPGALFLRNSEVCLKCKNITIPIYGIAHKCFQDDYFKSLILGSFIALNKVNRTWDKFVDKVVVLTPFIKGLFIDSSLGYLENKLVIKPNSTDDLLQTNPKKADNHFLFVGRLSKEKGVKTMVEAFCQMANLKLDIIGTGELEEELKKEATPNITFHGIKNREFIKEKLNCSKALVFPSIWYEGLPNTILEAFSSGTPVICSDIDNLNQIISQNINGVLFKPNDAEDLKQTILNFQSQNTSPMEIYARATYEKEYSHQRNFENLKKIYSELVMGQQ